jgi:hypothetical protein
MYFPRNFFLEIKEEIPFLSRRDMHQRNIQDVSFANKKAIGLHNAQKRVNLHILRKLHEFLLLNLVLLIRKFFLTLLLFLTLIFLNYIMMNYMIFIISLPLLPYLIYMMNVLPLDFSKILIFFL